MESPSVKLKQLKIKKPKADLSVPKVQTSGIDINAEAPDLNLSAPKIGTPDADLSLPNAGVDVDVPTLDADVKVPKGKLKFPTMRKLNFSGPKVKSPDVDIAADVSRPDLNLSPPGVDVNLPNTGVDVDVPSINAEVEGSKSKKKWPFNWRRSVESKDGNVKIKAPEVDGNTEIKLPKNIPLFKTHSLPASNIDSILQERIGAADVTIDPAKTITDAVVSVSSVKTNLKASSPSVGVNGQRGSVDVLERLRLSNARTISQDCGISSEPGSPPKANRGTFKVTNPDANKDHPVVDTTSNDKDAKLSLSLNNMLCLQTE